MLTVHMPEDTPENMKELGLEHGVDTSIHSDFGDFAPPTYEHGQGNSHNVNNDNLGEDKRFVSEGDMDILAKALLLSSREQDELSDNDKAWINDHKGAITNAVRNGNFDSHFANQLGIRGEQENTPNAPQTTVDDDRWSAFGGVDWDAAANSGEATVPPVNIPEDQKNNWYRELAEDWRSKPQTREYWIGNQEKGVQDKRSILQNAGMTDQEISELVNDHTFQNNSRAGKPVRPEDISEINVSKPVRVDSHNPVVAIGTERVIPTPLTESDHSGNRDYLKGIESMELKEQIKQIRLLCQDIQATYPDLPLREISRQDPEISAQIGRLEREMRKSESRTPHLEIFKEALMEAKVFIGLHDTVANLNQVNFKADEVERDIKAKYKTLEDQKRALSGVDLAALLKNEVISFRGSNRETATKYHEGLPVGKAHMLLQEVSTKGLPLNPEIRLGDPRLTADQKALIKDYLYTEIKKVPDIEDPDWTLELAELYDKFSYGTSLRNLKGSDPVSKAMYLQQFRESTLEKKQAGTTGDDLGPYYTIDAVPSVGLTSLDRHISIKDSAGNSHKLANARLWETDPSISGLILPYDLQRYDPYNPVRSASTIVDPTTLRWEDVTSTDIKDYFTKAVPAGVQATDWFLRSDWSLSELRKDNLEKLRSSFNVLDPDDNLKLAPLLVIGILTEYQATVNPSTEKVEGTFGDPFAVRRFLDLLKRQPNPFLKPEQVTYIESGLMIEDESGRERKLDPVGFAHNIRLRRTYTRPLQPVIRS